MPSYNKLKEDVLNSLHRIYRNDEQRKEPDWGQSTPHQILMELEEANILNKRGATPEQKERLLNEFKQATWEEVTEKWIDINSKKSGLDRNSYYERD